MKKIFFIFTVLLIAAMTIYFSFGRKKKNEITYKEVKPVRTDIRITVTSTGTVSPQGRIEMKPPVPGRIDSVSVKEGDKVRKGQILAWMSSTERAALLDSARAVSTEEYKRFQEYYKATPIFAPVSGQIILRSVEPGQTVAASDVLLVISDKLQVVAKVDETDIARVKPGVTAEIILDAYSKNVIKAKVSAIAFEAKTVNNVTTYDVEALPNKQPDFMRSGMTANVTFILSERVGALALPMAAIQFNKESPFVLVKDAKGKPVQQAIETGESDGGLTEIVAGLNDDAVVLIPGIQTKSDDEGSNPFMMKRGGNKKSGGKGAPH
ncbi:MAG TPA: HlyD family efflux transporter periplasmic adaptor subunit [Turneriella sp.]|nr:HlyD family efflux transporter periplasmic adaptor subunit [Turneriella sp.]